MEDQEAASILAKMMIKRKADKQRKSLSEKFWNSLVWKKEFGQQMIAAFALLKLYSYESIIAALNHKDIQWVYSLRTKQIIPYIKDEETKRKSMLDNALKTQSSPTTIDKNVDIMRNNKSRISRLD